MVLMTLANKITISRFFVTLLFLAFLTWIVSLQPRVPNFLYLVTFIVYFLAAASDWLDGYVARKYKEVTHFGRIADPFVDKIIICGALIYFLSIKNLAPFFPAELVVVVMAREFLVHGIRSVAEAQGIEFGANWLGKLKFNVQAFTVGTALWYASYLHRVGWTKFLLVISVIATAVITVASGAVYVWQARKLFSGHRV